MHYLPITPIKQVVNALTKRRKHAHNDIVQKLWNLCDVLRDDGINYSDYVTELVLLLFMKMVYENTEAALRQKHILPEGCRWADLNKKAVSIY